MTRMCSKRAGGQGHFNIKRRWWLSNDGTISFFNMRPPRTTRHDELFAPVNHFSVCCAVRGRAKETFGGTMQDVRKYLNKRIVFLGIDLVTIIVSMLGWWHGCRRHSQRLPSSNSPDTLSPTPTSKKDRQTRNTALSKRRAPFPTGHVDNALKRDAAPTARLAQSIPQLVRPCPGPDCLKAEATQGKGLCVVCS